MGLDWETLTIGPLAFTSSFNFDEGPLGQIYLESGSPKYCNKVYKSLVCVSLTGSKKCQ